MKLIILAAGQGSRLKPLTDEKPKCLTPLLGKPLLEWQILAAQSAGIQDIIVVGGYKIEQLRQYPVTLVKNELYASTNMVHSLFCAQPYLEGDVIISYGDIVYDPSILNQILQSPHDISVAVDLLWQDYWAMRFENILSDAESLELYSDGRIKNIGQKVSDISHIQGQYIGLTCYKNKGIQYLINTYDTLKQNNTENFKNMYMTSIIQSMIDSHIPVQSQPIHRGWCEIDNLHDLAIAEKLMIQHAFFQSTAHDYA